MECRQQAGTKIIKTCCLFIALILNAAQAVASTNSIDNAQTDISRSNIPQLETTPLDTASLDTTSLDTTQSDSLSILIPSSIVNDFDIFVSSRDILSIDHYGGHQSRREVAELVLLYQALYLGGYKGKIEYVPQEVDYLRSLKMLGDGRAAIFGTTAWYENVASVNTPFWVTQPLVREGEFIVGIYTSSDNDKAMAVSSLNQLRDLRAVSNLHWGADWRNLESLQLPQIYSVRNWTSMARMVKAKRADFTLAPFRSTPGRTLDTEGFTLTPIPNVSFALEGSRHWVTSKKHAKGKYAHEVLSRGLTSLRNQGTITRAYRESGFFQSKSEYWPAINRPRQVASVQTRP